MLTSIRYTMSSLFRTPGIMVWALVFPIILSSVFVQMFSSLDEQAAIDKVPIVVVEPGDDSEGQAFQRFIDAMTIAPDEGTATDEVEAKDDEASQGIFDVTYAATAEEAERIVVDAIGGTEGPVGYVELVDGVPQTHVVGKVTVSGMENLYSSIVVLAMDEYAKRSALVQEVIERDPWALSDPVVAEAIFSSIQSTTKVQLTENQPRESVRYYFALLGMAALFGASVGLEAFRRTKPNVTALGARRSLGALSHGKTVLATILGSWILCFICLLIAFFFIEYVCHVDFGGRDGACVLVIAVSSLMATALGCAVSAIPKVPEPGKNGLLTGFVCFAALFAGLYGQPTMELADTISRTAPIVELINPASQIAQSFYSVMYYESLTPLLGHLGILLIMAVIFFLLSSRSLRRQRYASL